MFIAGQTVRELLGAQGEVLFDQFVDQALQHESQTGALPTDHDGRSRFINQTAAAALAQVMQGREDQQTLAELPLAIRQELFTRIGAALVEAASAEPAWNPLPEQESVAQVAQIARENTNSLVRTEHVSRLFAVATGRDGAEYEEVVDGSRRAEGIEIIPRGARGGLHSMQTEAWFELADIITRSNDFEIAHVALDLISGARFNQQGAYPPGFITVIGDGISINADSGIVQDTINYLTNHMLDDNPIIQTELRATMSRLLHLPEDSIKNYLLDAIGALFRAELNQEEQVILRRSVQGLINTYELSSQTPDLEVPQRLRAIAGIEDIPEQSLGSILRERVTIDQLLHIPIPRQVRQQLLRGLIEEYLAERGAGVNATNRLRSGQTVTRIVASAMQRLQGENVTFADIRTSAREIARGELDRMERESAARQEIGLDGRGRRDRERDLNERERRPEFLRGVLEVLRGHSGRMAP